MKSCYRRWKPSTNKQVKLELLGCVADAEGLLSAVFQEDAHIAKLTVQETLDFSARCQGTGIYQGDSC